MAIRDHAPNIAGNTAFLKMSYVLCIKVDVYPGVVGVNNCIYQIKSAECSLVLTGGAKSTTA